MKKTNVAVGVIIALGVIWTGAAWLTGKQLESHMDELAQNANTQFNAWAPNNRLNVSYQDYQRGVFSSKAKLVLQASSQTENNSLLKQGQSIVFNETIDHGPFPFAQLRRFTLIPSMASVHSELENTDALKTLFALTDNKSPIKADTRISYSGATYTALQFLPLDYQSAQNSQRVAIKGGTLNVSADSKGDKVSVDSDIGSIAVTSKNEMGMPVLFTANGVKLSGNTHLTPEGVRIGDQKVELEKLNASVDGKEALTLQELNGTSSFHNKTGKISGDIDYHVNNVRLQNNDFGEAKMSMKLAQFDAQAVKAFSDSYNAQMQDLMNQQGLANDPIRYQAGVNTILMNNLPTLLKGAPLMSIAPLSWKNSKGESIFNLTVNFNDPATVTGQPKNLAGMVDRVMKNLSGKLVINIPMATEVVRNVGMVEGYTGAAAQKLANQQVKGLAAMGQMFHLTRQQDNNIVTSLQYANGQVNMNGDTMSLEQFMSRYMLGLPTSEGVPQ